ncbi:MAG: mandelate racemase/muconate lactonizing enzyme family protein [Spirochaetales bacterium]|nr:mandelate racemase/muconate lactonizing enzyme family protein [Spirochaetales bacterium]
METTCGLRGWGDISSSKNIAGVGFYLDSFQKTVIGRSPLERSTIINELTRWSYPDRNEQKLFRIALSAVDQCLADLQAKIFEVPLYKFYGAAGLDSIPLYANVNKALRNDRSIESLVENSKDAYEQGFSFVKITIFDEVHPADSMLDLGRSLDRIKAVAEIIPIDKIAFDCHQRFTRYSLCRMISELLDRFGNPFWIEDTVQIDDYKSQKAAVERFPQIRFAAGEVAVNPKEMKEIIDSCLYDVIMPDIRYIGGPSVVESFIKLLNELHMNVSIHNPGGLISTAHAAHLSALDRNMMPLEFPFRSVCGRADLAEPTECIKNGRYYFNEAPGIGVEIRNEVLLDRAREYVSGTWESYKENY